MKKILNFKFVIILILLGSVISHGMEQPPKPGYGQSARNWAYSTGVSLGLINEEEYAKKSLLNAILKNQPDEIASIIDQFPSLINIELPAAGHLTPLMLAAGSNRGAIVEKLLAAGANVNYQNNRGRTALMQAAEGGFGEMIKKLISVGAHVNLQDGYGNSALHIVAQKDRRFKREPQIASILLANGAQVNLTNAAGQTALMNAIRGNYIRMVRILISADANVNLQDANGNSALHIAAQNELPDIAKILLENGARVDLPNNAGETADMILANKAPTDAVQRFRAILGEYQPSKLI